MAIELTKGLSVLGKVAKLIFNILLPGPTALIAALVSFPTAGAPDAVKKLSYSKFYFTAGVISVMASAGFVLLPLLASAGWVLFPVPSINMASFSFFAIITAAGMAGRLLVGLIMHPPINFSGSNSNAPKFVLSRIGSILLFGLLGTSASDLWHIYKKAPPDYPSKMEFTPIIWKNQWFMDSSTNSNMLDHKQVNNLINPKDSSISDSKQEDANNTFSGASSQ
jgi:hypothetical protein